MFEEIVNRPSRWRVFWPDVRDLTGAREAIRLAVWFAYLAAGLGLVATLFTFLSGAGAGENFLNVLFFAVVGWGVQREWRTAAVVGAAVLVFGLIAMLSQGQFPGVITPFVLVGMVNGVRGTFAVKRLSKAESQTVTAETAGS
jgi:hypothetical protein